MEPFARVGNFRRHGFSLLFFLLIIVCFTQCKEKSLPPGDSKNGGLFLPGGFEAVVVVDSLKGRARHLAVNNNGNIYVKLRFPDSLGGNAALRDTDNESKADMPVPSSTNIAVEGDANSLSSAKESGGKANEEWNTLKTKTNPLTQENWKVLKDGMSSFN